MLDEHFHFAVVPVAVRCYRKARLGAAQHRHPGLEGLAEHLGAVADLLAEDVLHHRAGIDGVAELHQVGLEGQCRHDEGLVLEQGFECRLVHLGGVDDLVETGFASHLDGLGAAAVARHRDTELVRQVTDGAQLFHREGDKLALAAAVGKRAGDVYLDPVAADLDLAAHLGHDFVLATHHACIRHGAGVGHQPAGRAADRGHQRITAHRHTRAFNHAVVDGFFQVHAEVEQRVGVEETGDAGGEHLPHIAYRRYRGHAGAAVVEKLVVAGGIVKGAVYVAVNQARHHRQPAGVVTRQVGQTRCGGVRLGAHCLYAVAHHQ